MNKEELEKEAEDYVMGTKAKDAIQKQIPYFNFAQMMYLAGAESREKQIQIDAEQIRALQKTNGALTDRVKELEAQIENMKCWCNCKNYLSCLEECCRKNIPFAKGICYNCKKWEIKEND